MGAVFGGGRGPPASEVASLAGTVTGRSLVTRNEYGSLISKFTAFFGFSAEKHDFHNKLVIGQIFGALKHIINYMVKCIIVWLTVWKNMRNNDLIFMFEPTFFFKIYTYAPHI